MKKKKRRKRKKKKKGGKGKKGGKAKKVNYEDLVIVEDDVLRPKFVFKGHKGWIFAMKVHLSYLYTGSDDK